MVLTPRRFLRAIGVRPDPDAVGWTIAVGVREHVATLNIVAMRQRRIGVWSRVAGDTMDLVLLARAYRHKRSDGTRLIAAAGLVGGIMVADLVTAVLLTRAEGSHVRAGSGSAGEGAEHDAADAPGRVTTAVTIRRPAEEVRRAFRDFDWTAFNRADVEASGGVRFTPAPGDRGTEVQVDQDPHVRGGALGEAAGSLLGRAPDQRIEDELRRFKALMETGVVVRSATSPEGPSSTRQILHKRQPAQPLGEDR